MSDYINKTDAAYDDPFDISEITSAYECVKGDPFDISELSAAIESKIGNFVRKISPESFEFPCLDDPPASPFLPEFPHHSWNGSAKILHCR